MFFILSRRLKKAAFALLALGGGLAAAQAASAAVLVTNGSGEISGVTGLEVFSSVNGSLLATYDVTFMEGTCIDLYTGCDNNGDDLPFETAVLRNETFDALAAFLGDINDPTSIAGCESTVECYVTSASNINLAGQGSVSGYGLYLLAGLMNDLIVSESFAAFRDQDLTQTANRTWALFSPSGMMEPPSDVPVPGALILMLSGIAGLSAFKKRKI